MVVEIVSLNEFCLFFNFGQTPKSDIPPNIAPEVVTPENCLQICDSSATQIGQLAIVTLFGAILFSIPLSGPYPLIFYFGSKIHIYFFAFTAVVCV